MTISNWPWHKCCLTADEPTLRRWPYLLQMSLFHVQKSTFCKRACPLQMSLPSGESPRFLILPPQYFLLPLQILLPKILLCLTYCPSLHFLLLILRFICLHSYSCRPYYPRIYSCQTYCFQLHSCQSYCLWSNNPQSYHDHFTLYTPTSPRAAIISWRCWEIWRFRARSCL